jgi:nitric oxide reductase subunit B
MVAMTGAFAVAGISQVYLEKKLGLDFLLVQKEIAIHFVGLILAASLFSLGAILFIYQFIKYGTPKEEAMLDKELQEA